MPSESLACGEDQKKNKTGDHATVFSVSNKRGGIVPKSHVFVASVYFNCPS